MTLRYVPQSEMERVRQLPVDPIGRAEVFADACRLNILYMIARAGSGHIGTSLSCIDILSWLHLEILEESDRYFSSKGHDAPALYAVLLALGRLEFEQIHRLRRLGGLAGHPDVLGVPAVVTNTGSLGMGVSKAKGFVLADRLMERSGDVYVLTGDGELQEGQFWESLAAAANRGMSEITVIVDHNKIQSDTWVAEVSDLGDLESKVSSFGWAVGRCDGNDIANFASTLGELKAAPRGCPRLLIADTQKGAGVSFMESHSLPRDGSSLYPYHSGAPGPDEYERAVRELESRLVVRLEALGAPPISLVEPSVAPIRSKADAVERLVPAYGEAIAEAASVEPRLVALDADLVLDCGLIPFRQRYPDRFVECGIAEQDMVSQAGSMALAGLLPAVHSFACFLSSRPNEQIYNNASEGTKVIYVGSLAGLVPGGPGHSHQSVRDISALGAVPGLTLVEPSTESETRLAVSWAVHDAPGPVYIRLVSAPWALGFEPPDSPKLIPGRGQLVREGRDGLFIATGPIMLSQAWQAAERLVARGVAYGVLALPWLRDVDGAWLAEIAGSSPVVCLDNHYVDGGQGDAVLRALADATAAVPRVLRVGVASVPACGTDAEVLRFHLLDAESIAARVESELLSLP